jgi:hypothetical protein
MHPKRTPPLCNQNALAPENSNPFRGVPTRFERVRRLRFNGRICHNVGLSCSRAKSMASRDPRSRTIMLGG